MAVPNVVDMTTFDDADRALKAKHRVMWALGDYSAVADDIVPELGGVLVAAGRVGPDDRVLDVAAGTGNAAIPAARTGARVTATDLTPELLEIGQKRAAEMGLNLDWQEADAEALPFADGEFDAILSCLGIMFAPHHQASADELIRVCRPGGRIALINWTPEGYIGQMFAAMKPYAAPAPPGAQPPPLWGSEEHVRGLLGSRVADLVMQRRRLRVSAFANAEAFRDYFKANYGPTVATYRLIAEDPEKTAALDAALVDVARRHDRGDGVLEWEYLLVTAVRA